MKYMLTCAFVCCWTTEMRTCPSWYSGINVMDPPQTVYSKTVLYTTFDITSLLNAGAVNDVGALLGNYKWGYTDQWCNMYVSKPYLSSSSLFLLDTYFQRPSDAVSCIYAHYICVFYNATTQQSINMRILSSLRCTLCKGRKRVDQMAAVLCC